MTLIITKKRIRNIENLKKKSFNGAREKGKLPEKCGLAVATRVSSPYCKTQNLPSPSAHQRTYTRRNHLEEGSDEFQLPREQEIPLSMLMETVALNPEKLPVAPVITGNRSPNRTFTETRTETKRFGSGRNCNA